MLYSPDENDDEGLRQTDGQALLPEPSFPPSEDLVQHCVRGPGSRGDADL